MNKLESVSILGSEWTIKWELTEEDEGCSSTYAWRKEIHIDTGSKVENVEELVRHEVIHAFQFESGLAFNWEHKPLGVEETTVDWFAIQWPKISKVFKLLEVEE